MDFDKDTNIEVCNDTGNELESRNVANKFSLSLYCFQWILTRTHKNGNILQFRLHFLALENDYKYDTLKALYPRLFYKASTSSLRFFVSRQQSAKPHFEPDKGSKPMDRHPGQSILVRPQTWSPQQ